MSRKPPAFQLYASDFLSSTIAMTPEQVGAYIRLLCYQWEHGSIPDDEEIASRIAGCHRNATASIWHKFGICQDGVRRNARLERVRAEQAAFRTKQSQNAKKGWEKRKKQRLGNATAHSLAMPPHQSGICQNDALQSPSPYKDSLNAGAGNKPEVVSNPQVTPPTLEEVKNIAASRGVALDCAEAFFNANMATGWVDGRGIPIRNWTFALNKYSATWRANEHQRSKAHAGNQQNRGRVTDRNAGNSNAGLADEYRA